MVSPFDTICLGSHRTSQIDAKSGTVTGLIDFEGATIAPLWGCAVVPGWLPDPGKIRRGFCGGQTRIMCDFLRDHEQGMAHVV